MKLRPSIFQAVLIATTAILLCACRSVPPLPSESGMPPCPAPMEQMGGDMACQMVEPMQVGMPGVCPEGAGCDGNGSWKPDGLKRPWPRDEYLVDGGDRGLAVEVAPDWTVYGLESEDTVAHFDTLDGQTMVEASNQVCVYAPRFSAVRKVTSLVSEGQVFQAGGVTLPEHLARQGSKQEVWHGEQFVQLGDGYGTQPPVIFDNKQQDEAISTATNLEGASGSVLPYQKLAMIKEGRLEMSESAVLARGVAAAIVWSRFEHVEIVLDGVEAVAFTEADKPFSIYTVDEPPARPKLRLCKIASTAAAKPGEVVEFTLRFDNTGNQPIGNIVLMDNLTARFEYVEGSTDTTLPADFSMELTDTGTTVLRWELKNALNVNQGGVIRFKCRVR